MRKRQKKKIAAVRLMSVLLMLCILGFIIYFLVSGQANSIPTTANQLDGSESVLQESAVMPESLPVDSADLAPEVPETRTVTFSAVGDNLIHGSIYLQGRTRAEGTDKDYDFTYLYQSFSDFLSRYDVNFINQETLVTDEIAPATYPQFASPGEIGRAAYQAGWRIFGTSNNHIYDQGALGIASTRRFWAAMPEDVVTVGLYAGEEDYSNIRLQKVNDITIAYLAYTQYTNGIPTPADAEANIIYTSQEDVIEQQLTLARQSADVVVVSVHWGVEDSHEVTEEQRALAVKMGNWGADVILGTHPHVIQTVEILQNDDGSTTLCNYSLGNFVSAQSRPDEMIGSAMTFDITMDVSTGAVSIENVKIHPVITDYSANFSNIHVMLLCDYTPELALQHGVRGEYPNFDYDYIKSVVEEYIPAEYIDWEN